MTPEFFSWVILSGSPNTPRPGVRGFLLDPDAGGLPQGVYGWHVRDRLDGLAPPESALRLMEAGATFPGDRDAAIALAAEWRAAIREGSVKQADDARSEEQVSRFVGDHFAQAMEGD